MPLYEYSVCCFRMLPAPARLPPVVGHPVLVETKERGRRERAMEREKRRKRGRETKLEMSPDDRQIGRNRAILHVELLCSCQLTCMSRQEKAKEGEMDPFYCWRCNVGSRIDRKVQFQSAASSVGNPFLLCGNPDFYYPGSVVFLDVL